MATKPWPWVVGCLLVLSCGGWLGHRATRGWTEGRVRRVLDAQCPPLGSSRAEVMAWLLFNPFSRPDGPDIGSGKSGYEREVGLDPSKLSDCLSEACPDPNVGIFCFGEMEVFFYFDKQNDKLVYVHLRPWIAGPGL